MISFWNMLAAYWFYIVPPVSELAKQLRDIVAAMAVYIGFAVFLFYLSGCNIKAFYDRLLFPAPLLFWLLIDYLVHFAPLLILGVGCKIRPYLIAYAILLVWYIFAMGSRLKYVYRDAVSDPRAVDTLVFLVIPVCISIGLMVRCTYQHSWCSK
jgi:hypothetical protein